ncbi:phosphotransferase [Arthrobacter sp. NPDC090010]|uniref:maltokinase N-terminal cap-like domain-containing protein n=1 Tax=Arthrobacter sp. NPDC090010 TaxID=3363942 RepID=UPI00381CF125
MDSPADVLMELLEDWLPRQRWFPAKGRETSLSLVATLPCDVGPGVRAEILLIALGLPGEEDGAILHVPLLFAPHSDAPVEAGRTGLIGTLPGPAGQAPWDVFDGPRRHEFITAVLEMLKNRSEVLSPDGTRVAGRSTPTGPEFLARGAEPLSLQPIRGEQSNSSVIIDPGKDGIILKFFRTLFPGRNPEVELGEILTRLRTQDVPVTLGWLEARWDDGAGTVGADLAVAHEFLSGGRDAWMEAVRCAAEGVSFARQAHAIGQGTARIHRRLAEGFPPAGPSETEDVITRLAARVRESWEPSRAVVGPYDAQIDRLLDSLSAVPALPQRIHGDLHLGQILSVPVPGGDAERWVFLDFEGEPLRSAAERSRPDLPLRDVVGLLRSLDYAAGAAQRRLADSVVPAGWVRECSEAFLEGYSSVVPGRIDQRSPLFMALWLDKALYEVRYEQSNRPDWLDIPAGAARLTLEELAGDESKGTP